MNAPEFTINRDINFRFFAHNTPFIQHSKSSGNIQKQVHLAARSNEVQYFKQPNLLANHEKNYTDSSSFETQVKVCEILPNFSQVSLLVDQFEIISLKCAPKVKFCLNSFDGQQPTINDINGNNSLQRSKSMSSADILVHGMRMEYSSNEMGNFLPEMQKIFDQALSDPNKLNARFLMILANQIMQRAVEGRRYGQI